MQENQPEQALQFLQQHLAKNPNHALGYYCASTLLRQFEQLPQALATCLTACRLDPNQSIFFNLLGVIHTELQMPEQAIQAFNAAYEKDKNPEIRHNLAHSLLLSGRFQEGFQELQWRIQLPSRKKMYDWHPAERRWQGQPFPGQTLLVYHEQGMGDHIQFCRYLPYVKALGGKVIYSTYPHLLPIMSTLYGADEVMAHTRANLEKLNFQWAVPLMSLPHFCRTTLDSIPNQTPYLAVPPAYKVKWSSLLAPCMSRPAVRNIGFVFSCNPTNKVHRTIPFSQWHSLFSLPDTQWFSVQKGEAAAAVQEYAASHSNVIDLTEHINDFADTAALLDSLDLLISIDTSAPHLAGALGKPVWLLLPFATDWRWLLRRSDSPWYPTFRLFRQPFPGQWEPVMAQVVQALSALRPHS